MLAIFFYDLNMQASIFVSDRTLWVVGNSLKSQVVLVCLGYYNKTPYTVAYKQEKFISPSFGGWEIQIQDTGHMW
jgi:hypothetical protein